jgi:hypothetical protein
LNRTEPGRFERKPHAGQKAGDNAGRQAQRQPRRRYGGLALLASVNRRSAAPLRAPAPFPANLTLKPSQGTLRSSRGVLIGWGWYRHRGLSGRVVRMRMPEAVWHRIRRDVHFREHEKKLIQVHPLAPQLKAKPATESASAQVPPVPTQTRRNFLPGMPRQGQWVSGGGLRWYSTVGTSKPSISHLQAMCLGRGCDPQAIPMQPPCGQETRIIKPGVLDMIACWNHATIMQPLYSYYAMIRQLSGN